MSKKNYQKPTRLQQGIVHAYEDIGYALVRSKLPGALKMFNSETNKVVYITGEGVAFLPKTIMDKIVAEAARV